MNPLTDILNRLRNVPTAELSQVLAEYEAYLSTLTADEQKVVMNQVNAILRELAGQSVNRLEEATSGYLSRYKVKITV